MKHYSKPEGYISTISIYIQTMHVYVETHLAFMKVKATQVIW